MSAGLSKLCVAIFTLAGHYAGVCSCPRDPGPQPASRLPVRGEGGGRVPGGGIPQHHQLLDEAPDRDAAEQVRNIYL